MERSDKQAWMIAAMTRTKKLPAYNKLSREKSQVIQRDGLELKKALQATAMKEDKK